MNSAERVLARASEWGRAPSAHNTQPWQVRVDGEALVLGWHADRVLEVGDPTRRDLLLSLGCVAEAIAIVAADEGLTVDCAWQVDRARRVAGRIEFGDGAAQRQTRAPGEDAPEVADETPDDTGAAVVGGADHPAAFSVAELVARRTARTPYAQPPVTAAQVERLARSAGLGSGRGSGLDDDLGIDLTAGAAVVLIPADVVARCLPLADRWTFEGPATAELRDWLRLDAQDPAYSLDGLSDEALGLSRPERVGLRLALQPVLLRLLRVTRLTALLGRTATARPLGAVVALTAAPGRPDEEILELGRQLLRVWLTAGRAGLSAHPLSQLLDCPQTSAELGTALGPQAAYAVFRLGRPATPPARSHRLTD